MKKIRYFISFGLLIVVGFYQQCSNQVQFSQEVFSSDLDNEVKETLRDIEPVMAVRGTGCISCHANVSSGVITDFGHQNSFFMGANSGTNISAFSGAMYGDHDHSWKTSKIAGSIIVPETSNIISDEGSVWTLAEYLTKEEAKKAPADQALSIIEKERVFIGAPTVSVLRARFSVDSSVSMKFIRNKKTSAFFSGLELQPSGYYKNVAELNCDGDLYINGTVLLDNPVVSTVAGCRLYATETIFLQGTLTYRNLSTDGDDRTNLQLVSSTAVIMGVGTSHCESAEYTGSYFASPNEYGPNPLLNRLTRMWTVPGQNTRQLEADGRTPAEEGARILAQAAKIPEGLRDASCFPQRREVDLNRILVNAPQIHSRYRGNFDGVMISEVALASLSAFRFQFDPVFKTVPVIPLLKQEDFLDVR